MRANSRSEGARAASRGRRAGFIVATGVALGGCTAQVDEPAELGTLTDEFSTICATSSTLTPGIDVSKWQGDIDWPAVRSDGYEFAIVRTTHGTEILDEYFEANWQGAKNVGMIRGTYQYYRPGQDPIAQADTMLAKINAAGGMTPEDLPPVLDLETDDGLTPTQIVDSALTWLNYVEQQTQKRPMVYSAAYFGDTLKGALGAYPLWVANYKSTYVGNCPKVPDGWSSWKIWQWSESGTASGINTNSVDLNVFDGSLDDLRNFAASSNLGPGGAGGAGGGGGAGGTGTGGTGTGGTGGDSGAGGGTGAVGGGTGGSNSGGSGPGPIEPNGCTFTPDCSECSSCIDACLCHEGDWQTCLQACGPTGGDPGGGDAGGSHAAPGASSGDDGGCSIRSPGRESPWAPAALFVALVAALRRRLQRST